MVPRATGKEELAVETTRKVYTNTGPDPKTFTPAEGQLMAVAAASIAPIMRLGTGMMGYGYKVSIEADDGKYSVFKASGRKVHETSLVSTLKRPVQPPELYEFEGCPFCKKVREAVTILDLDVLVRPCPKDGATWRPQAIQMGGKRQFPFLVDPNTGKQLYESDEIIKYLFNEYGPGEDKIPFMLKAGMLTSVTCGLGLLPRAGSGNQGRKSILPAQPLRVWMYDASPFVKLVRERLCELELPYLQITTSRGSPKRQQMLDMYGKFQVPFLEDPNTNICMFESKAIIEYLEKTYAAPVASN